MESREAAPQLTNLVSLLVMEINYLQLFVTSPSFEIMNKYQLILVIHSHSQLLTQLLKD